MKQVDIKNIPFDHLQGKSFECYVCAVYDGDTITVVLEHNHLLGRYKIRMVGYNSPEIAPEKKKFASEQARQCEISKAKEARDKLKQLINNKICTVQCGGKDKYGRTLGTMFLNEVDINQWMLSHGYGVPYNGGTKNQKNKKTKKKKKPKKRKNAVLA